MQDLAIDTSEWTVYAYEFDGRSYETAVSLNSPLWYRIARLEVGERDNLFIGALKELIGVGADDDAVERGLNKINAGGSHCIVRLSEKVAA